MSLADYDEVRASPRQFLNASGHHAAAEGAAKVVSEREGYEIVENIGWAGEIAAALDQRVVEE